MAICSMTARQMRDAIRQGRLSAVDVMAAHLERIENLNPAHNAIISLRPREELLAEARNPREGRLSGLPIAIKDLAQTKGLRTTFGSPIFADNVPREDDLFVARLRAEGAIIIGKTNTPEFGLGSQTYNPVHGITRNALDPSLTSGGSSGGAAVAVALEMLPFADGSDMGGSLRNPAGWNGIYGLRPSQGRVPAPGDADQFFSQLSTEGPMARNPDDLGLLLSVMAGPDPRAPLSLQDTIPDDPISPRKARIGLLHDIAAHLPIEPGVMELCQARLPNAELVSVGFDLEALWQAFKVLRQTSSGSALKAHYDNPAQRDLLKSEAIWEIEQSLRLTAEDIYKASVTRTAWVHHLLKLFERYDALALPSAQVFAFRAELKWPSSINGVEMDSYHRWMQIVTLGTMSGFPVISIPAGIDAQGRAMGVQLIGPPRADWDLLRIAAGT